MIPRPPSRSERLLRDTLRKDDTLRTHATHRPRSTSSNAGDDGDDDDFFQSAILFRCSSRRNSAVSALSHPHSTAFYVPDQSEQASFSCLLRSSSLSGSSRSGRSERKSSPRPGYTQEKHDNPSHHHDTVPHTVFPPRRFRPTTQSPRMDSDKDALESSTSSLPSSFGSSSNSHTQSHESHQTHITSPDPDACVPSACRSEWASPRTHRHSHSTPVMHTLLSSPQRASAPPRVSPQSSQSPRSPRTLRSPPRTPTLEKDQRTRRHPDSPWLYAPLPPSPPAFPSSPSRRGGPDVVTFVASPTMLDPHPVHSSARSSPRHSPQSSPTFDPEAASHALKQLPGYVSFASVAGLGAPPEEDDLRPGRRPFTGFALGGGKGRSSGLGLGSGKWWMF